MKEGLKKIIKNTPGLKQIKEFIDSSKSKISIQAIDEDLITKKLEFAINPADPLQKDLFANLEKFNSKRKHFGKIIIWGFKTVFHTHRFIHRHFHDTLIKLGDNNVIWVDDSSESASMINKGDLVIAMNMASEHLPYKKDVFYCLHNIENEMKNNHLLLNLQVHHNRIDIPKEKMEVWEQVTFFSKEKKTLFQSWGTDLLPTEFYKPVFSGSSKEVFWIGSIWNNKYDQGNLNEMDELKSAIEKNKLAFVHTEKVSVKKNIELVRKSRIAPAISGKFQVDVDYLPCRVYKNISYGQPAITNVARFQELFGASGIKGKTISELISNALSLSEKEYLKIAEQQQIYIANNHTYLNKLVNIFSGFEQLYFK